MVRKSLSEGLILPISVCSLLPVPFLFVRSFVCLFVFLLTEKAAGAQMMDVERWLRLESKPDLGDCTWKAGSFSI